MSLLRKKYYSLQTGSFIDVETSSNTSFNSSDVGSVYNNETVRLIKFNAEIESAKIDELVSDLIYNDKLLLSNFEKINSLISNGSFYSVGDNFQIYDVEKEDLFDGTYIKSFGIKSGQIKYNDEVIFLEPQQNYKIIQSVVTGTSNVINLNNTTNLSTGSIIFGSEFLEGTMIQGITGTQVSLSKNFTTTPSSNSLVLFMDIPTFTVGDEIDLISSSGTYPIWRRDLISYDITNLNWEVTKGQEILTIPPVNTQLDVLYQIESIIHINNDLHRIKLNKNNRTLINDFSVGQYATIHLSNNKTFDGKYEITSIDSINNTITVRIPLFRNSSKNQTDKGGYIDLNKIGVLSILVYKASANSPSLIIDEIEKVVSDAGITGGLQQIIRAQIESDNKYYSIKTNDRVHLLDGEGRLLDWDEGQGFNVTSQLGYTFTDNDNIYNQFQIPFPDYADIETGYLTNIPFILEEVNNNIFGLTSIDLTSFKIGIKSNPVSIGQEGISYRVTTHATLSDELDVVSFNIQTNNGTIIKTVINNPQINFLNFGINLTRKDFILITDGTGSYQIGKISAVGSTYIEVINLFKPIDSTSKFIIFNNTPQTILNSESYITNDSIRAQVLSGINGYFGQDNVFSKIKLGFGSSIPKIEIKKWHFLNLQVYSTDLGQQGTPFIAVSDFQNSLVNKSSAFIEIFYDTVSGKYPSGNLLIEDEFGDIFTEFRSRTESPHFRPAKYQLFARALDKDLNYPQGLDEVFVDVHIGKIKFHPLSKPRKLFVSYYKTDVIDGSSSDFSLKHTDIETGLMTTVQDKITEIDSKFNNTVEVKKAWKVNGLMSSENSGFMGPFTIDESNNYNIIYKDTTFENFTFDEDNYTVKLSNHLYDNPIYIGENNVILDNISLGNTNFTSNTLISNFDFLDYESGVSGYTLPQIGFNFYNEYFTPIDESFNNELGISYKKKKLFETPINKSEMTIDTGLYDSQFGVNGKWNYLYSSYFNKNNVLYGLLRKDNYENLLINANPNLKRRLRQREFIRLLDKNFNNIDNKSNTQIISEKFLSKSLIYDNIKYKENYLQLKVETTKYKDYKILPIEDINGNSLGLINTSHNLFVDSISLKRSTLFINNKLVTSYINPNNSKPYYKIISFYKTNEIQDVDAINNYSNDILIDDITVYEIQSCIFNTNYIAIAYVYEELTTFYIRIKIFSIENNLLVYQTGSQLSIGTLFANYYFNINEVSFNKIAIVWKKNENEIALTVYTYSFVNKTSNINQIRIIENQNSLLAPPSISYFGINGFIVGYSNLYGSKIKLFDLEGNLIFFDSNQTIDYRILTNKNISTSSNFVRLIELDNNDIAIVFLDKNSNNISYDLKLVILDVWTKNWKYPLNSENTNQSLSISIPIEYNLTSIINSVSICILNEDIFCISYIKNTNIYIRAFKNDGGEIFSSYTDFRPNNYSLQLNRISESSIMLTHINSSNFNKLEFSIYNFRPDFTVDSRLNNTFEVGNYIDNNLFKAFNFEKSSYISIIQSSSTNLEIKIINTNGVNNHFLNNNYSPLNLNLANLILILDIKYVEYNFGLEKIRILLILSNRNNQIYLNFVKFKINSIINAGELLINTNSSNYVKDFGNIIQLQNNFIGIVLRTNDSKYNIQGVSTRVLETADTFGTAIDGTKYTINTSNFYNPVSNVLSGVNISNGISFYKKNDNNFYLFYSSVENGSSGTYISRITSNNAYENESGIINFSNLNALNRYQLDQNNQYNEINFVENEENTSELFVVANSSGNAFYHKINFTENDILAVSSQSINVASGVIQSEINIFNYSEKNNLILIYNERINDVNNYKIKFLNKNNLVLTSTQPVNLFINDQFKGNILKSIKSNYSDIYLVYNDSGKVISRTLSSFFSDDFLNEVVTQQTDSYGVIRNRIFTDMSLKINGINWRGLKLKQFVSHSVPSLNLDSTQIDSDGVFRSEFFDISAHLVSISKDTFSVIYYYHKDKTSDVGIKLRNYIISRGRIFIDSDWINGSNEIGFEENKQKIYLRAVQLTDQNIFYIWYDSIFKTLKTVVVNRYNQTLLGTYQVLTQSAGNNWITIRGDVLVENWITALVYNLDTQKYYTLLFNPDGKLHRFGNSFSLPFNITTTLTSQVTINQFGYFMWTYMDNNQNLKYYQHGFDGDPWGVVQIVGKNYLGHLESTADSPIESNLFNSAEFKFLKYNRAEFNINNNSIITLEQIFEVQESGLYRVLCIQNPLVNFTFSLVKVLDQEPIISIDTSSTYISNVFNTNNKFNVYISNEVLTFQNKLGKNLIFRFYKEN